MIINFTDLRHKLHTEYGVHFETCPVGGHYMICIRKWNEMNVNMSKNWLSILQWETLGQEVANGVNNGTRK